jgi:hypothetical protein
MGMDDLFYQAMEERHNFRYFKYDEYPPRSVIEDILAQSHSLTPIKNNSWHFQIKVYGPEFAEDKRHLCLQTCCNHEEVKLYRKGGVKESRIGELDAIYEQREQSSFRWRTHQFNDQVRAPYLLVYQYHPFKRVKQRSEKEPDDPLTIATISAAMHGYVTSVVANKHKVQASFCRCFYDNQYNFNRITADGLRADNLIFFLGLGYQDVNACIDRDRQFGSLNRPPKPDIEEVLHWI